MNCGGFIKFVTKADSKKKMSAWKKAIKERDSYTCQRCGKLLDSTKLDAHHKMPVWFMDQLKFDIDNGITLCKACHHALHGAGGTINESKEEEQ